VSRRFLYFWDIKRDIWHTDLPFAGFWGHTGNMLETVFYGMSLVAFIGGLMVKVKPEEKRPFSHGAFCLLLTFMAGTAAPLLIFSSSRFSVPLLPIIFLFQARFVIRYSHLFIDQQEHGRL